MVYALLLAHFIASTLALSSGETKAWTPGQEVETQSGRIQGHIASWPSGRDVSEYLGIPYAKPPVGSLRFAPPVLNKSNATFIADKFVSRVDHDCGCMRQRADDRRNRLSEKHFSRTIILV
jgi:carboxylesterase type B